MQVTDREATHAAVAKAVETFGTIDICIACAGINDGHPLATEGLETWEKIMAVNVTGTFLTPTGDHRVLAGELRGRELRLSKFDGGHVFLYHGTLAADDTLAGQFWSGIAFEDRFTARRDENASLGDADQATKLVSGDRFDFRFPDLGGVNVSLRDQFFKGKVVVVALAGSWCPKFCTSLTFVFLSKRSAAAAMKASVRHARSSRVWRKWRLRLARNWRVKAR
jgi:NAD(P)-dependent dehydrogenase (short-subunit alcohol dehydrogenase family)